MSGTRVTGGREPVRVCTHCTPRGFDRPVEVKPSVRQAVWICRHGNRIDFTDPSWKGDDPHLSSVIGMTLALMGQRCSLSTGVCLGREQPAVQGRPRPCAL